jgi:hypothetical protein
MAIVGSLHPVDELRTGQPANDETPALDCPPCDRTEGNWLLFFFCVRLLSKDSELRTCFAPGAPQTKFFYTF